MARPWVWCGLLACLLARYAVAEEECAHLGPTSDLKSVCMGVEHDGLRRTYRVYRPESTGALTAIVFVLHGAGGSGAAQERIDGGSFARLAARERFLLVFPDGIARQWSDGRGRRRAGEVDDVGFLTSLLDQLRREHGLTAAPAFVAGMSNGGMMAYRLACDAADRFAAAAAVVANLSDRLAQDCRPQRPISLLVMNGTADPLMPYDGGEVGVGRFIWARVLSTADTVGFWARTNGCTAPPVAKARLVGQFGVVTEERAACRGGTQVRLIRIEAGGHTWPGGPQYLPAAAIGPVARDFDGSAAIWAFFMTQGSKR